MLLARAPPAAAAACARRSRSRALLGARQLSSAPLERTALYDLHLSLGGKMVPFAGYELPVQYPDGVLKSHLHARAPNSAALFDVGHMGQLKWFGKDRVAFLERVCVADVQGMAPGASALTLLTLPTGGILDDSIISDHSAAGYQCVAAPLCAPTAPRPPPSLPFPQLHGDQRRHEAQ
jgi:glycine cleavage system aminomethyltransferase T